MSVGDKEAQVFFEELEEEVIDCGFSSYCIFLTSPKEIPNEGLEELRIKTKMDAAHLARAMVLLLLDDKTLQHEFNQQMGEALEKGGILKVNDLVDPEWERLTKTVLF